jgi:hypothetical protein
MPCDHSSYAGNFICVEDMPSLSGIAILRPCALRVSENEVLKSRLMAILPEILSNLYFEYM